MPDQSPTLSKHRTSKIELGQIFSITSAHLIHDTFTAFVAPLLPLMIEKLSLSLTLAGALPAFMQLPAILNPLIGYLADKFNMRYFVIFAPAATASLIGLIGFAPNYLSLSILLLLAGISSAFFHSPAPAMVAQSAKDRVGFGMSLYMAAGELGRTLGPLIAVSIVSIWSMTGISRLIAIGWGTSLILFWRFKNSSIQEPTTPPSRTYPSVSALRPLFIPLLFIVLPRSFLTASITTYLPTYMHLEGSTIAMAGISLSILEGAGVLGALFGGTLSDRIGRKRTMIILLALSSVLALIFLQTEGWLLIPVLALTGFISLAPQPVILALVQDHFPQNRSAANGLYMTISFLIRSIVLILLGAAGDAWGLKTTFYASAFISLLALPAVFALPNLPKRNQVQLP